MNTIYVRKQIEMNTNKVIMTKFYGVSCHHPCHDLCHQLLCRHNKIHSMIQLMTLLVIVLMAVIMAGLLRMNQEWLVLVKARLNQINCVVHGWWRGRYCPMMVMLLFHHTHTYSIPTTRHPTSHQLATPYCTTSFH